MANAIIGLQLFSEMVKFKKQFLNNPPKIENIYLLEFFSRHNPVEAIKEEKELIDLFLRAMERKGNILGSFELLTPLAYCVHLLWKQHVLVLAEANALEHKIEYDEIVKLLYCLCCVIVEMDLETQQRKLQDHE